MGTEGWRHKRHPWQPVAMLRLQLSWWKALSNLVSPHTDHPWTMRAEDLFPNEIISILPLDLGFMPKSGLLYKVIRHTPLILGHGFIIFCLQGTAFLVGFKMQCGASAYTRGSVVVTVLLNRNIFTSHSRTDSTKDNKFQLSLKITTTVWRPVLCIQHTKSCWIKTESKWCQAFKLPEMAKSPEMALFLYNNYSDDRQLRSWITCVSTIFLLAIKSNTGSIVTCDFAMETY